LQLWNRKILPFGPNVTRTVFANLFTPSSRAFLASMPYLISFAMIFDLRFYSKYSGTEVELDGEEYIIVKQSDILAIME